MSRQSRNDRMMGLEHKLMISALVALLVIASLANGADALGVTPGRKTMEFSPGLEETVTFVINNNEHKDFNAYVYVEGGLAEYITIDQSIVPFKASEGSKAFSYRVRLPDRLDPPGEHWGKIVVMELPPDWESGEGAGIVDKSLTTMNEKTVGLIEYAETGSKEKTQIVATVAVVHQLKVKVPYPGKYLSLDLNIQEAVPNESVKFFVKMFSLGTEDIAEVSATIDILGPTNDVIASLDAGPKAIRSMQSGELFAVWKAEVNPGKYHARVTVKYDGETGFVEKNFYVGNMLIQVLDVSVKDFRLGGIAKFDIEAESKWNQPVSGVFAHMVINDLEENKIADFKSPTVDFEPFERAHLYAYWDTEGVNEGEYITNLRLHFAGKETEREIKTYVGLESIETDVLGISVGAVTAEPGEEQYQIYVLVIVLIAINLGWFVYFRRRRR